MFQQNASSNNIVSASPNPNIGVEGAFGILRPIQRQGTQLQRFEILLHANNINNWVGNNAASRRQYATSVMAHELGHAVGLVDNPVGGGNTSLMSHNRNRLNVVSPSNFDILSVNMLYN